MTNLNKVFAGLQAFGRVPVVAKYREKYYRSVAHTVLRWYSELEDGTFQSESGRFFDTRIIDYRLDVEAALRGFNEREILAVLLVHRDGLTHQQALRAAGLASDRPDLYFADLEARMGQSFERKRLGEFLEYVNYFR